MPAARAATATFRIPIVLPSPARCSECVGRLCAEVKEIPGVTDVECDSRTSAMTIAYDPVLVSPEDLEERVHGLGLEIVGRVEHATYRITGLD
jgi:copper chaperone CopZ